MRLAAGGAAAPASTCASSIVEAAPETMASVFASLEGLDPKWRVELGQPQPVDGWIAGLDLTDAGTGPFQALLTRMHERARTSDRKTIAASFALRFGWAGAVAIAPYLTHRCVPRVGLDNVSIKFRDTTLFERTAIHHSRGWRAHAGEPQSNAPDGVPPAVTLPLAATLSHRADPLLRRLRQELDAQAAPVVRALHDWSGFASRGSWGMITSSWAAQFIAVCERLGGQAFAAPILETFFVGDDDIGRMQPRTHTVTMHGVTHLYQRRSSCCRYYLLPQGNLCASCPLVSHDERLRRNREFMAKQLARQE
jgi:hypothetical protein